MNKVIKREPPDAEPDSPHNSRKKQRNFIPLPAPVIGPERKLCKTAPRSIGQHIGRPLFVFDDITAYVRDRRVPSLHSLQDICIEVVLSYCSVVECFELALVCKRLYNLCFSRISRIKSFCSVKLRKNRKAAVESILSLNNGSLKHLRLHHNVFVDHVICRTISRYCPNLETLVFSYTGGLSDPLPDLPKNLKSLGILINHDGPNFALQKEYLERLLKNAANLEKFQLNVHGEPTAIDGRSIVNYMARNKVTYLGLRDVYTLTPEVIEFIFENYCETLEHLDISTRFTTHQISIKSKNCEVLPNIKRLYMSGIGKYRKRPIYNMSSFNLKMPSLTDLDVSYNLNMKVDPLFIKTLTRNCPLIEVLNISGTKPVSRHLQPLKDLKYLRELQLDDPHDIHSDLNFDYYYFVNHIVPYLVRLDYLGLRKGAMTDQYVYNAITKNRHIKVLDVSKTNSLNGTFVVKCQGFVRTSIVEIIVKSCQGLLRVRKSPELTKCLRKYGALNKSRNLMIIDCIQEIAPDFIKLRECYVGYVLKQDPPGIWWDDYEV